MIACWRRACNTSRAGEGGALEAHRADVLLQLAGAPAFDPAHLQVEVALEGIVEVDQGLEVRPAQFSPQCGDNLRIRKGLGKPDKMPQVLGTVPAAVLLRQGVGQSCDDFFPIGCPFLLEEVGVQGVSDLPVKPDQFGIDRDGSPLAGLFNQVADLMEEGIGRERHGVGVSC